MEPFKSSTMLCNFFRRWSAVAKEASATPACSASSIALLSLSFAPRIASTSFGTDSTSRSTSITCANCFSFSSSSSNMWAASLRSASVSFASRPFAIAAFSSSTLLVEQAAASTSRARSLGSSSCSTAWAFWIRRLLTQAFSACSIANFSLSTILWSVAATSAASASSLDFAASRYPLNSSSSDSGRPSVFASSSATRSLSMLPSLFAVVSLSRAACFGISASSTCWAWAISESGTLHSLAFLIADFNSFTSLLSIAPRSDWLAFLSFSTAFSASATSLSPAPCDRAAWIAASSSVTDWGCRSNKASFSNSRSFGSCSSD
mmetsp:Transcript_34282/g.67491  ORF Transcript_34282/g.67491 Transcript_34282/m.67491 type:complete len:320 (-) Transcript_34282:766-1725(-)